MGLEKRGNPRKSRRVRLPSASYAGTTRFMPSAAQWRRMEEPLGVPFSDGDRRELVRIIDTYFRSEALERAAPFADDAQAWLSDVRTEADAFWRSLQPQISQRDAAFFVQRLITQNFKEAQQSGPQKWHAIIYFMSEFVDAVRRAGMALSRQVKRGFLEGYAWRALIRGLTRFCQARSLPVGASKGIGKSRRGEPSPFVAFVYELQVAFPKRFRRHNFSHEALAKAIAVARRTSARDRKSGPSSTLRFAKRLIGNGD